MKRVGAGLSSPARLWLSFRYEQLQIKMQEMAGETSDLRYVVAGLFNAVPEVFASLDPGRLKGIGFVPHRKRSEVRTPSADTLRIRAQ
jgi:hypothetical protein